MPGCANSMPHCATPCHPVPCHTTLCSAVPCHAMPCCAIQCHALPPCAMHANAALCHATPCCASSEVTLLNPPEVLAWPPATGHLHLDGLGVSSHPWVPPWWGVAGESSLPRVLAAPVRSWVPGVPPRGDRQSPRGGGGGWLLGVPPWGAAASAARAGWHQGLSPPRQGAGEHCYYQGRIRGQPRSFAALSSCQGLR